MGKVAKIEMLHKPNNQINLDYGAGLWSTPLLTEIASKLFDNIPAEVWHGKSASDIEIGAQQLMNEVAMRLLDEFIIPATVAQVEESIASGKHLCAGCRQPVQLHKGGESIHVKTIFGSAMKLCRNQYYCPSCDRYEMVADQGVGFVGAAGIWSLQEVVFPYARPRLDEFHLKEKIYQPTAQACPMECAKQKHQCTLLADVDQGMVAEAASYIKRHMPPDQYRREAATKLINYLQRHEARIPNYGEVKAEGATVSSGLMEKGNDLVVVRRMKEGVMHWTREGAEPVIQQRTAFINKYARARTGPYELAFCHALDQ